MKAFSKAAISVLALCATAVMSSPAALAQTIEDPAEVTQAELDLLNGRYAVVLDQATQEMLGQMQSVLRDQVSRMPEDMRPWLLASFDRWFDQAPPRVKAEMAHMMAATLTLQEIENDMQAAPERIEAVAAAQRQAGYAAGIRVGKEAWTQACRAAPPEGVERCDRIIAAINEFPDN